MYDLQELEKKTSEIHNKSMVVVGHCHLISVWFPVIR